MSARERFCTALRDQLGKVSLWNGDGPEVFDCSGLICFCLHKVGGPDLRATHSAQRLHDETPHLATFPVDERKPMPGDLIFHGYGPSRVTHVSAWLSEREVISADGATSQVRDLAIAKANPTCRVRLHSWTGFRKDLPYLEIHRNAWLDAIKEMPK